MIQRIQTVFLLLAIILDVGVFFTPLYTHAMNDPQSWIGIGIAILLTISAILSVVCIVLYNNRSGQAIWVKRTLPVQTIAVGWGIGILVSLGGFGLYLWDEALGVLMLTGALVAQLLALRGIRKDEELVRSMDRIR